MRTMTDLHDVAIVAAPQTLRCPPEMRDHVREVLAGEYEPGVEFSRSLAVLDLGANVGAFSAWASRRWPGASIEAYEPHPETFKLLRENLSRVVPTACVHELAVREHVGMGRLRIGKNNLGESSFYDLGEQGSATIEVGCEAAGSLPPCGVLKIDTEGCEVEILDAYFARHGDALPACVLFEFHSEADRITLTHTSDGEYRARCAICVPIENHAHDEGCALDALLAKAGIRPASGQPRHPPPMYPKGSDE